MTQGKLGCFQACSYFIRKPNSSYRSHYFAWLLKYSCISGCQANGSHQVNQWSETCCPKRWHQKWILHPNSSEWDCCFCFLWTKGNQCRVQTVCILSDQCWQLAIQKLLECKRFIKIRIISLESFQIHFHRSKLSFDLDSPLNILLFSKRMLLRDFVIQFC